MASKKRYKVFATAFDKKNNVIGQGVNEYKRSHPLMKKFAMEAGEPCEKIYIHAELAAVLSAGKKNIHKVLVQRFDSNGNPALAKPCKTCQCMLKTFGVKIVQYTSAHGVVQEYVKDLSDETQTQISLYGVC